MDDAYLDGLVKMLRARKTSKDGVTRQPRKHEREAADAIKHLRAELANARDPNWFYNPDSVEMCCFSVEDAVEAMDLTVGVYVREVDCAKSLPSIWCVVEVLTDKQMEERDTDDQVIIREFATEAEALAALETTNE